MEEAVDINQSLSGNNADYDHIDIPTSLDGYKYYKDN
jgi:hypothetical protein